MPGEGITVGLPLPVLWGDRASVTRAVGIPLLLAKASQCQSFKDQQSNSKSLDYKSCNFKKYTWGGSLLFLVLVPLRIYLTSFVRNSKT